MLFEKDVYISKTLLQVNPFFKKEVLNTDYNTDNFYRQTSIVLSLSFISNRN